ncbi:MAG: DUF1801 domain-containing protein [Calditrichota bacterium]
MSPASTLKKTQTIGGYIAGLKGTQREVAEALTALIRKTIPKAEESIKWGVPWWEQDGELCCLYKSQDHVNLGFWRGTELTDPDGLLEGSGKGMRHVKYWEVSDIKKTKLAAMLKEALRLNRENPKLS